MSLLPNKPRRGNTTHDNRPMRSAYVPRGIDERALDRALKLVKWRKEEERAVRSALQGAGLFLSAEYVREVDRYADAMSEPPSRAVSRVIRQLQQEGIAK